MTLQCSQCGSTNIYNHDKGFSYLFRMISGNSRLVCRDCKTTWRRNLPNQFSKLKVKYHRRKGVSGK